MVSQVVWWTFILCRRVVVYHIGGCSWEWYIVFWQFAWCANDTFFNIPFLNVMYAQQNCRYVSHSSKKSLSSLLWNIVLLSLRSLADRPHSKNAAFKWSIIQTEFCWCSCCQIVNCMGPHSIHSHSRINPSKGTSTGFVWHQDIHFGNEWTLFDLDHTCSLMVHGSECFSYANLSVVL